MFTWFVIRLAELQGTSLNPSGYKLHLAHYKSMVTSEKSVPFWIKSIIRYLLKSEVLSRMEQV